MVLWTTGTARHSVSSAPARQSNQPGSSASPMRRAAQLHLVVAAEGIEGVGGTGTDLNPLAEGDYCALQYNSVRIDEDGDTAVLIGKATEASNPYNNGAYVKITAHTDGRVNFVFQALTKNGAQTGAAGLNFTGGTVTIEKVLP